MPEDFDLDTLDKEIEGNNRVETRIKDLSEKVRLTSEERDEKDRLLAEQKAENEALKRENTFNSGFVDVLGNHPSARDHKDDIKAKVLSGMSIEDATFAVLGKAGKLGGTPQPIVDNPAGGSAVTQHPTGEKHLEELSRDEKRAKLLEAEKSGEISMQ